MLAYGWNLIDRLYCCLLRHIAWRSDTTTENVLKLSAIKIFRVEISRLLKKRSHQEMGIIFFRKENNVLNDIRNTIRYGQFVPICIQGSIKDLLYFDIHNHKWFFIWLDFCAQWQKEINQGYQIKFHKRTKNHLFG